MEKVKLLLFPLFFVCIIKQLQINSTLAKLDRRYFSFKALISHCNVVFLAIVCHHSRESFTRILDAMYHSLFFCFKFSIIVYRAKIQYNANVSIAYIYIFCLFLPSNRIFKLLMYLCVSKIFFIVYLLDKNLSWRL